MDNRRLSNDHITGCVLSRAKACQNRKRSVIIYCVIICIVIWWRGRGLYVWLAWSDGLTVWRQARRQRSVWWSIRVSRDDQKGACQLSQLEWHVLDDQPRPVWYGKEWDRIYGMKVCLIQLLWWNCFLPIIAACHAQMLYSISIHDSMSTVVRSDGLPCIRYDGLPCFCRPWYHMLYTIWWKYRVILCDKMCLCPIGGCFSHFDPLPRSRGRLVVSPLSSHPPFISF